MLSLATTHRPAAPFPLGAALVATTGSSGTAAPAAVPPAAPGAHATMPRSAWSTPSSGCASVGRGFFMSISGHQHPTAGVAQFAAMDDHVEHAARQQPLGALETVGILLADLALRDALAGEADAARRGLLRSGRSPSIA